MSDHHVAFADLVVYDRYENWPLLVSMTGLRKDVWAVAHTIRRGQRVRLVKMHSSWPTEYVWTDEELKGDKNKAKILFEKPRKDEDRDGGQHLIVIHPEQRDRNAITQPFMLLNVNEQMQSIPVHEAFYREWQKRFGGAVPGLPMWAEYVWHWVRRRHAYRLQVYQEPGRGIEPYMITMGETELREIVSKGLRDGELYMPDGYPLDDDELTLDGIESVADYLHAFSAPLSRRVHEMYTPRYIPGEAPLEPTLANFGNGKKKLLSTQEGVAQGLTLALRDTNSVILNGEQGSGKTPMALAIARAVDKGKPGRWIIQAPPYLVGTWQQHIAEWVPEARSFVVESLTDLQRLVETRPWKPQVPEFVIISRERAKLGSTFRPAVLYAQRVNKERLASGMKVGSRDLIFGPVCPDCGEMILDRKKKPREFSWFNTQRAENHKCPHCETVLWGVGYPGPGEMKVRRRPEAWQGEQKVLRRYPLAEYIKRRLKRWAVGFICDEVHEMKNDTAQSVAFGSLAAASKYLIATTGTLSGGYAHDTFRLLFRVNPEGMKSRGFTYDGPGLARFVATYGRLERITKTQDEENSLSRTAKRSTRLRALPMISPRLFGEFVMDRTGFLRIEDLGEKLPPYEERVELVEMEPDLALAYREVEETLRRRIGHDLASGKGRRTLSTLLSVLNYWPDRPWGWEPILDKEDGSTIVHPPDLGKRPDRRKVQRLAEIVAAEKAAGRKCLILCQATDRRDVQPWVAEALEEAGLTATIMYSRTVKPADRLAWVQRNARTSDALICNPRLIETGLTLLEYPTIIFFEVGYNLFTLRQASRRSWRIGQTKPVRVVYLAYQDTLQEKALQLMGAKMEAAMGLEGRLVGDGLRALSGDEDVILSLAKSLVSGIDTSESAEEFWQRMAEKERMAGSYRSWADAEVAETEAAAEEDGATGADPAPTYISVPLSAFVRGGRKKAETMDKEQLVFF